MCEYESLHRINDELLLVVKQLQIHLDDDGRRVLDFLLQNILTNLEIRHNVGK